MSAIYHRLCVGQNEREVIKRLKRAQAHARKARWKALSADGLAACYSPPISGAVLNMLERRGYLTETRWETSARLATRWGNFCATRRRNYRALEPVEFAEQPVAVPGNLFAEVLNVVVDELCGTSLDCLVP